MEGVAGQAGASAYLAAEPEDLSYKEKLADTEMCGLGFEGNFFHEGSFRK